MSRSFLSTPAGRLVAGTLAVLVLAVVAGLVALWPAGGGGFDAVVVGGAERAEVEQVSRFACEQSPRSPCQGVTARLLSGPDEGRRTELTLPGEGFAPRIDRGDTLRVVRNDPLAGQGGEAVPGVEAYSFSDFERRQPLLLLAVLFALLVVALARWKGVRSLIGLALSLVLVTQFMVPAILEGSSPLLVALVGSLAVMLVTIGLSHGTGTTSVAAVLGSTASLLATALLALLFVELAQVTGFSSEEATLLQGATNVEGGGPGGLSVQGLVLAGMVVGALGVLDDVTVSQASTVVALRRANPAQSLRRLFGEGLSVGRDHLSATVNTLVLAYVGAALPVLLIFESQGTSFGDAVNYETVAGQVVAMLVGSIGLVLAVPLTTGLAAWLARRLPVGALADEHAHHHH